MTQVLCITANYAPGSADSADVAVLIDGARIAALGPPADVPCPPGAQRMDARGLYLVPGLIDLQINGAFGLDFTADPGTIWDVGKALPRYGVTTFLPTIVTSPLETVSAAQRVLQAGPPPGYVGAEPLGLHLEGPFLSPLKRGAHDPALMRLPSLEAVRDWSPGQGVRLVTLAPELPVALEVIRALCERGVLVSAGHSAADYQQAQAGLAAGVRYGTHLFNAMPALDHRAPGLVGALLGCTPAQAVATATAVPARALGLADRGTLAVGARADLALLTPDLHVAATIAGGQIAWQDSQLFG
jgi:N-acetylglucosamine-6-phosphate deacetylase